MRPSQNRRQGRAQFMRDRGEKLVLQTIGVFSFGAGLAFARQQLRILDRHGGKIRRHPQRRRMLGFVSVRRVALQFDRPDNPSQHRHRNR